MPAIRRRHKGSLILAVIVFVGLYHLLRVRTDARPLHLPLEWPSQSRPHPGPAEAIARPVESQREAIAAESPTNDAMSTGPEWLDIEAEDHEVPHWEPHREQYPVPAEDLISLPRGEPVPIPPIQHPRDGVTDEQEGITELRRSAVLEAFQHAWGGYKAHALPHDELLPVTAGFKDPFSGWGATLVDALDSLWIMDLKEEFMQALDVVAQIDFTTSTRNEIPLFETVIRYLGGLLGAYDISNAQHPILLEKAQELGEMLMGAFDTPNRMPHLYYRWAPPYPSKPHRASTRSLLAEIGSLSLEFTRLAQITQDDRYYDAIARITNELETWQNQTTVPGLWPVTIDASGCRRSASQFQQRRSARGLQRRSEEEEEEEEAAEQNNLHAASRKRQHDDAARKDDDDCEPQGLTSPPAVKRETFTLGAMADSTYEYLAKEWLLLGGVHPQYRSMYEMAAGAVRGNLVFEPMTRSDRDLRFIGTAKYQDGRGLSAETEILPGEYDYEAQHLTCFAGGMFALGAKVFARDEDLALAGQLTDACVWAYAATQTGIMPERAQVIPCGADEPCVWNETMWWDALDSKRASRETKTREWLDRQNPTAPEPAGTEDEMTESLSTDSDATWEHDGTDVASASDDEDAPVSEADDGQVEERKDEAIQKRWKADVAVEEPWFMATHSDFVRQRIAKDRLPPGFTHILQREYFLRPEAIESVFVMYRLTGDPYWQDRGWEMFQAINASTWTPLGHSALQDVTREDTPVLDSMESFWLAETLKYFYLLFSHPSLVSLDEFVFNTEAHPFRLAT